MSTDFVYLASASPRRRELLQQIGVSFRVLGAAVDEAVLPGEAPAAYVVRVAAAKAGCGWDGNREGDVPVLAADTVVVLDGKILGKPKDRQDAAGMLQRLSGRTHEVLTAVALRTASGLQSRLSRSAVTFRAISAGEAGAYWETGEPCDKAGAYAIQEEGDLIVEKIVGSYTNVVGLPLERLRAELNAWAGA